MLELKQIEKVYRADKIETIALSQINMTIEEGDFLAVMGPSGCGKSTLLNIMGILDVPTGGRLLLDGEGVERFGDRRLARIRNRQIGFIFQSFHLISDLSVADNVEIPLLYRRLPASQRRKLALEALERVGLAARVDHFPTQLSGGQQQRVAIARAVAGRPRLLLADEPTGNLDSHMGDEIMRILEGLNQDGTAIVMVTHDEEQAARTNRVYRVFDGQLVA